mmetsp:Transcript_10770/g.39561  ORF Transcript_10770/g.39561 Transcript_10770/m.39561 type:complete len:868 (-) Transcript_10770:1170-3773(-)
MSSVRLRDLIRAVRACKTAAQERGVIKKETANIISAFNSHDVENRHRNVAKLMFIHMLGYPTHFGQMECLKLIAANGFPEKRMGYLALMVLLDERQEVLMLVTNSVKNDLASSNQFVVGLALCALGNICSTEMARDLAPEVEKLLASSNSYIRKKAALCAIRVLKKVPEMLEIFEPAMEQLLSDRHHGVLIAGVTLLTELLVMNPDRIDFHRKQVPQLVRILRNLVSSGYSAEHTVGGLTDPFLQVKVLRLLRILGAGDATASDIMSDMLAQVATNTDGAKNAGNAVLYECVQTIMGVESIGGLRVLGINILGKFLAKSDNNIRYVALNTLSKIVNVDTQAVQRHRNTIVDCVKDADVSIRRRALDLVYALVNEQNILVLSKELLEYLMVSDAEFRVDLTQKICSLVEQYAPDKQWHIDTIMQVLSKAGEYVPDEVCRRLVVTISNATELQGYSVRSLYKVLQTEGKAASQQLMCVAIWTIGEYGEMILNHQDELPEEDPMTVTEMEVIDLFESLYRDPLCSSLTRQYLSVALVKLSSRFSSCLERIKELVKEGSVSVDLELQSRAVHFEKLCMAENNSIRASILERMPAVDEKIYGSKEGAMVDATTENGHPHAEPARAQSNGVKPAVPEPVSETNMLGDLLGMDTPTAAAPHSSGDVLSDLLGDMSSPAPAVAPATGAMPSSGADLLADLLGSPAPAAAPANVGGLGFGGMVPPQQPAAVAPQPAQLGGMDFMGQMSAPPATAQGFPPIVAFTSPNGLTVNFEISKPNPGAPQVTLVKATFTNSSASSMDAFNFQVAVPKFMQLQLHPASAAVLPPGSSSVTQTMEVTNSMHGQKPLVMRLKISYSINGAPITEQTQVNTFPQGC